MSAAALFASVLHPSEIYSLLKFKMLQPTSSKSKPVLEADRYDPTYTRAMCYHYLDQTSRSFARVIQELDQELCHPVCLFYLILRGLDTIEDDMTINLDVKTGLLQVFHSKISEKGWTFDGNGPNEKDRDLLIDFDLIIEEFLRLDPKYQKVIVDITRRMGYGMAEFQQPSAKLVTVNDYNLYTHYVAGLVGIGLTDLFVASGLESQKLQTFSELPTESEPRKGGSGGPTGNDLANRMGLFLQKVNILKDYLEDLAEGRVFWPEEIWRLYAPNGSLDDISVFAKPETLERSVACLNHLCADALDLVPDCLEYLSKLKCTTVFQFCAIPQVRSSLLIHFKVMAIASIALFFNNKNIFEKTGVKIRRGMAVELILNSSDIEKVKCIYQQFVLELHKKNKKAINNYNKHDKSFVKMATALGKVIL